MTTPNVFNYEPLKKRDVEAIKALNMGEATPEQQVLALKVIVNKLCRAHDMPYIPGSFDETAFLNGRGFVGKKIIMYTKFPASSLDDLE